MGKKSGEIGTTVKSIPIPLKGKGSDLLSHAANSVPPTDIPLPGEMQIVLDCLEQSIGEARKGLDLAVNRANAYVVQCAKALNVNSPRYKFDAETRHFTDNPDFKETPPIKPNGADHAGEIGAESTAH